jgi:hypothetical protein
MPIEGLTADAQLLAQVRDDRPSLSHGGLRKAELGGRHLRLAPAVAPACTGGGEPGEHREDAEHQLACGGCRINRGALRGEHAQSDAACIEVMHNIDQVPQIASKTIELPDNKSMARAHRFMTSFKAGPVVLPYRSRCRCRCCARERRHW